jgi:sucrose phosphorylase
MRVLAKEPMLRLQRRFSHLYGEEEAPQLLNRLALLIGHYKTEEVTLREQTAVQWDQHDSVLITYADMVKTYSEKPLVTLRRFLNDHIQDALRYVHILPFFPYSSDEGFSVIDYRTVDSELGDWENIETIGQHYGLMFDLVLNHTSRHSRWFKQFVNGIAPERDYFIVVKSNTNLGSVTRPRTGPLLSPTQTPTGVRHVWTTFSADQVDVNFANPDVLFEFLDILLLYIKHGGRIIRLDAIAYLWKQIGTRCVNLPETHQIVKILRDVLEIAAPDVMLITETNLPHEQNISYFGKGDEAHLVYQFSLPPLLLHALHTGQVRYLCAWASALPQLPKGCSFLNFTASHDGIGVRPLEGLVPDSEQSALIEAVKQRGGHVSSRTDNKTGKQSPYELNITYFDALSDLGHATTDQHINRFLCSQTIMLALKGIPAVYLHSLTATQNDDRGVQTTGQARSINRKRWNEQELNTLLSDSSSTTHKVFKEYIRLLKLRSAHPAFHPDGAQLVLDLEEGLFGIMRRSPDDNECLVCISNISTETKDLNTALLHHEGLSLISGRSCQELISKQYVEDEILRLQPYQSAWLLCRPSAEGLSSSPQCD